MSEKTVPIKESLRFGYDTTKNNFERVLQFAVIFIALFSVKALIDHYDGELFFIGPEIYSEHQKNKALHRDLYTHGYIGEFGLVQPKLQEVDSPFDLELSPEFEPKRAHIYQLIQPIRKRIPLPHFVIFIVKFVLWLFELLLFFGAINAALIAADGGIPTVTALFEKKHLFIKYLLGTFLYNLIIISGFILLIVPAVIWGIKFQYWVYQVIEEKSDSLKDAFKTSAHITHQAKMHLLKLSLVLILVNIAGAVCLLVGLIFTLPLTYITCARVYRSLEKQTTYMEK